MNLNLQEGSSNYYKLNLIELQKASVAVTATTNMQNIKQVANHETLLQS